MGEANRVESLITPTIEAMGYRLVRVSFGSASRPVLQIMAEPWDGRPMTVEDCALLSRQISALMDVEDPIPSAYTLEVSSPGIDRPLISLDDYRRFAGFEARIDMGRSLDGRKRFRGVIRGAGSNLVELLDDTAGAVQIPLYDIAKAKLILTDALIDATRDNLIPPPAQPDRPSTDPAAEQQAAISTEQARQHLDNLGLDEGGEAATAAQRTLQLN